MKTMHRFFLCLFSLSAFLLPSFSASAVTNSLPQLQALYGGQISGLSIIQPSGTTNQARLFVKTDFSANSLFYADVNYSLTDPFATNNFSWHVVPDFNAEAGFGVVEGEIAGHQDSGRLFVAEAFGLLSCTTEAGSLVTNIPSLGSTTFSTVNIHDSVLLTIASQLGSNVLYFGTVSPSGSFTAGAGSPINVGLHAFSSTAIQLAVNPVNHYVYIIDSYGTNGILKSSAAYNNLSGATFSNINISSVISNWALGRQIGFGPDGRMFIGSKVSSSSKNTIAYSDDDGASWTTVDTGVMGKGYNFDTAGSAAQYNVVIGRAVSTNKGVAGSWFALGAGDPPGQVRANDSATKFDLINTQFIYFASDQGAGCTTNGGRNLREIDFGLEAVAIQSMDMNNAKTLGWTASPSGLRRGTGAAGAAGAVQWESTGMFPLDDSAPYYSVTIDKTDSSGNTVYAGNGYIYKTTDGGTNWTKVYESSAGNELYISSIAASGSNAFAGIYVWSGLYNGKLLYSADAGATWSDFALEGTNGINVNKVLLTQESGIPTAYIAAEFNTNSSLGGRIYRVTSDEKIHVTLGAGGISIRDLVLDSSGGIYASGWDEHYQPLVFYKPSDSLYWDQLTTNGLPSLSFYSTGRGPVITIGRDSSSNEVPVVGAGVTLYYLSPGASSWTTSSELKYPNGTKLNVLYWDALLVGTTIGLYGQDLSFESTASMIPLAGDFDGDRLADPALYNTNGTWKIKLSSANYALIPLAGFLGDSGYSAIAADFDGDRVADPAVYQISTGTWLLRLSSAGYTVIPLTNFLGGASYSGYTALAGDFDGDRLADPAIYEATSGTWIIRLSTAGYATITKQDFLGSLGWTAIAADFDGDGKVDPAIYKASSGSWIIMLSSSDYWLAALEADFLGSTDYIGMGADFDGDRLADPAVAKTSTGNWQIRLSSGNYVKIDLQSFLGE